MKAVEGYPYWFDQCAGSSSPPERDGFRIDESRSTMICWLPCGPQHLLPPFLATLCFFRTE
jgi:hypothetical protein